MSDRLLHDPTNRVVSVFDDHSLAVAATEDLIKLGIESDQIRVRHGEQDAGDVETSDKWFADTAEEIEKYQKELAAGNTVVSVPVSGKKGRQQVHEVLKRHDARKITHFGEWIIEAMK